MENRYYPAQEAGSGSLRDFLTLLFKHKLMIGTVFLATVIAVTVGTFLLPPTYEAKSILLVKFGREYIYRPEVGDRSPVISVNQEEVVNSEIAILTSRDLVERVITTLKIAQIYPELVADPPAKMTPMQAAVIRFQKKLSVQAPKKSNVLEVTFAHRDPKMAAQAVNLLVDFYKEKHLQIFSGLDSSFLDRQRAAYDQKLKESEGSLQSFKQKNRVFALDEQRSLLLQQRMELDTSVKGTRSRIDELQRRLASLKSQLKSVEDNKERYTQTERDKIIVEAQSKLLTLQLSEQGLLKKYKEGNRLVQQVRKEIQLVAAFLKDQENEIGSKVRTGNAVYQEVEKEALKTEADLHSQLAKEKTLRQQLSQVDGTVGTLDLKENDIQNLKRNVDTNEKNYRTYVERAEEARISDNMNSQKMSNVSVVQVAAPPAKPVRPRKALNLALGVILGAVSGLGAAFFTELAAQGFSTPESAEKRLGIQVLATVAARE